MARIYKYQSIKNSVAKMSVEALVGEFNRQVGLNGWTSARAVHNVTMIKTFIKKGVDVSAIYDGVTISFARKIALNEDKTRLIFA